jgi:hypothetical protein
MRIQALVQSGGQGSWSSGLHLVLSVPLVCEQARYGGSDLLTISELMGHRTIQMTKRYAHLAPAHNQDAVDRLVFFRLAQTGKESVDAPVEPSATTTATSPESIKVA